MRYATQQQHDGWRDRRRRNCTFLARIRDVARNARNNPPYPYYGQPRRADQRAAVSHDDVSLPRWKIRTQHNPRANYKMAERHMPWRAMHSGPRWCAMKPHHYAFPRRCGGAQAPPRVIFKSFKFHRNLASSRMFHGEGNDRRFSVQYCFL